MYHWFAKCGSDWCRAQCVRPAAGRLAEDLEHESRASFCSRPCDRWVCRQRVGGRCRIEVGDYVHAVATFADPEARAAAAGCLCVWKQSVCIYDPVAGGAALVVLDVSSEVCALAVIKDPATGELLRFWLAGDWGSEKVHIYDPVVGGEALLVIDVSVVA